MGWSGRLAEAPSKGGQSGKGGWVVKPEGGQQKQPEWSDCSCTGLSHEVSQELETLFFFDCINIPSSYSKHSLRLRNEDV